MKKIFTFFALLSLAIPSVYSQSIVKNINPGNLSSTPYSIGCLSGNRNLFYADDGTNGYEIWVTDGTTAGTNLVVNINATGGSLVSFGTVVFNDKLYFGANDGTNGYELWVTDGTASGTQLVKDINPGAANGFSSSQIIIFNNKLYFMGTDVTNGSELWSSDGTSGGTQIVKNINPGSASSGPGYFYLAFGKLFFYANDGTSGLEWWSTDGSTSGTTRLIDLYSGANSSINSAMLLYNGWAYFSGTANASDGNELFRTDGTTTEMVKNINVTASSGSFPSDFTIANNTLYFIANDGISGSELWKTDGTNSGTTIVKNITPGAAGSSLNLIGELNGKLILSSYDAATGREIWTSDGSAIGTSILMDINTGAGDGINTLASEIYTKNNYRLINNPFIYNGEYYFSGNDGTNGIELWKTNGTTTGTTMLNQINPSTGSANINWIFVGNNNVWLTATDGTTGLELFKYSLPNSNVSSIKINRNLRILPNPGVEKITISEKGNATITDIRGVEVMQFENNGQPIDISKLATGPYIINVKNSNSVFTTRWLKY